MPIKGCLNAPCGSGQEAEEVEGKDLEQANKVGENTRPLQLERDVELRQDLHQSDGNFPCAVTKLMFRTAIRTSGSLRMGQTVQCNC